MLKFPEIGLLNYDNITQILNLLIIIKQNCKFSKLLRSIAKISHEHTCFLIRIPILCVWIKIIAMSNKMVKRWYLIVRIILENHWNIGIRYIDNKCAVS